MSRGGWADGSPRQELADKLTDKQQRAIAALLTCASVKDAALSAGVGERSLHRWLVEPGFRAAYAGASRQRLGETIGRLRAVAAEAVETLRAALKDELTANRIRAATVLLEGAIKVEIDDLGRRVEALEAIQHTGG
jgi:hypothetical protein